MHAPPFGSASLHGMIWRHVSVIGTGHRLCATAITAGGGCHAVVCKNREQRDSETFPYSYLFFYFQ
jgi:hypothetical protein